MTAPTRLLGLSNERYGRPTKSTNPVTSAALSMTTSFQPFITYTGGEAVNTGQWLDIGNAPGIDVTIVWTKGSGTLFTLFGVFGVGADTATDPTVGAPPPYIPSVSATGVTPAYPNQITFSTTDWTSTTSPLGSATVFHLRGYLKANGARMVSLYAKSDNASGSAVAYVSVGTQE